MGFFGEKNLNKWKGQYFKTTSHLKNQVWTDNCKITVNWYGFLSEQNILTKERKDEILKARQEGGRGGRGGRKEGGGREGIIAKGFF